MADTVVAAAAFAALAPRLAFAAGASATAAVEAVEAGALRVRFVVDGERAVTLRASRLPGGAGAGAGDVASMSGADVVDGAGAWT